jgi:hypothetical protein
MNGAAAKYYEAKAEENMQHRMVIKKQDLIFLSSGS